MKKRIAALLLVCLVLFSSSALALADYGAYFRANQRIATRNGPGTQYRGCATYNLQGQQVHLLSYEYDKNNVCWVEFEFFYKGSPMRLYTGLKRFDATTYDLYQNDVFEKYPLGFTTRVIKTCRAKFGPGEEYTTYDQLTIDQGQTVKIISLEKDWLEVEWTTTKQSYRAWMPKTAIADDIW